VKIGENCEGFVASTKRKFLSFKISRFISHEGAKRVYHTNHPQVNDDQATYRKIIDNLREDKKLKSPSNSEIRLAALEKKAERSCQENYSRHGEIRSLFS
jgi:hypothetical protein